MSRSHLPVIFYGVRCRGFQSEIWPFNLFLVFDVDFARNMFIPVYLHFLAICYCRNLDNQFYYLMMDDKCLSRVDDAFLFFFFYVKLTYKSNKVGLTVAQIRPFKGSTGRLINYREKFRHCETIWINFAGMLICLDHNVGWSFQAFIYFGGHVCISMIFFKILTPRGCLVVPCVIWHALTFEQSKGKLRCDLGCKRSTWCDIDKKLTATENKNFGNLIR